MKDGIDYIMRERLDQKVKHGFTTENDAKYKHDELRLLAMYCLMNDDSDEHIKEDLESYLFYNDNGPKMSKELLTKLEDKSKINKLAIAGALIAAELDRMIYRINQGPDENLPK